MGFGGGEAVAEGGEDGEEAAEACGVGQWVGSRGKEEEVWWGRAIGTRRDIVRKIGGRGEEGTVSYNSDK